MGFSPNLRDFIGKREKMMEEKMMKHEYLIRQLKVTMENCFDLSQNLRELGDHVDFNKHIEYDDWASTVDDVSVQLDGQLQYAEKNYEKYKESQK